MKLKLKVFDPKIHEMSMGDKIRKKILIKDNNNKRWNKEIEININEKSILDLTEHIIDSMVENKMFVTDSINRFRIPSIMLNEIDTIVKSARAWKSIHTKLLNLNYETSKFTRISLFEELMNQEKISTSIRDSIEEKSNTKNVHIPEISNQLEPV